MKKLLLIAFLGLCVKVGLSQVFEVDNYYMVLKNSVNKKPSGFNAEAFNKFLATMKVPVELNEQKIDGHVFVNVFMKKKSIVQTSLMYGISSLVDDELVARLSSANVSWFGSDVTDSTQRFVVGVKVDYRSCMLANVSSTNLSSFEPEHSGVRNFDDISNVYNNFLVCYKFDSASVASYNGKVASSRKKSIEQQLLQLDWFKPEFMSRAVLLDYDNNKSINVVILLQDSVHILDDNKLIFSEYGHLKAIKRGVSNVIIELETSCKDCNKSNATITVYKQEHPVIEEVFAITSYSSSPRVPVDSIYTSSKVQFNKPVAYVRTSPYKINDPFNRCMGYINEQAQCIVPKTWGNIFGEVKAGCVGVVLHNYTDSFKKKWFFVLLHRIDGYFVGWVHEDDVHLL